MQTDTEGILELMAESDNWAFPDSLQPTPEETEFDLQAALDAVVLLRSEILWNWFYRRTR